MDQIFLILSVRIITDNIEASWLRGYDISDTLSHMIIEASRLSLQNIGKTIKL